MDREAFTREVLARDKGCVVCQKTGTLDAHHLIERKLWDDGGYLLDNGISVCPEHHWQAERTELTVEALREMADITQIVVPRGWDPDLVYDKWGAIIHEDGSRTCGPLHNDTGPQKAYGQLLWKITWHPHQIRS